MNSAGQLMRAGAQMVKLEGGSTVVPTVAELVVPSGVWPLAASPRSSR